MGLAVTARLDDEDKQCGQRQQHPDARDHLGIGEVQLHPAKGAINGWREG